MPPTKTNTVLVIKKSMRLSLLLLTITASNGVNAWWSCVQLCDNMCSVPALNLMTTNMTTTLGQIQSSETQLGQAIISATQAVAADASSQTSLLVNNNSQFLSALSAYTNRIELATLSQTKAREALTDFEVSSIVNSMKEIEVSRVVSNTNLEYGSIAEPASVAIGTTTSCSSTVAEGERAIVLEEFGKNFDMFQDYRGPADSGYGTEVLAQKDQAIFDGASLVRTQTFTEQKAKEMQELVTMITNEDPKNEKDDDASGLNDEMKLRKKVMQAKEKMIHAVLSTVSLENEPLIAQTINPAYLDASTTTGKLGKIDSMLASVNGRLGSDGWWLGIKRLPVSGLLRESIYLKNEENVMLHQVHEYKRLKNMISALMLTSE